MEALTRARIARYRLAWALTPILLLASTYVFRDNLLAGIGDFLVIHDRLQPADLIFLLNGDVTTRPQHAALLFHQGLAPRIMIARSEDSLPIKAGAYPNPTDSSIAVMKKLGVPADQIIELRPPVGVQHTFDEAEALLAYEREHPLRKVIIVTSDLHSRRSRFIFRRVFRRSGVEIMLAPIKDLKYGANDWWRSEDGVIGCQNEYIKLVYYHIEY